jgi:hypothetical protein
MEVLSSAEQAQATLAQLFTACKVPLDELWVAYFALGGNAGKYEIEAYLHSAGSMSAHEHNVLAQAVNERLAELPALPRAPYRQLDGADRTRP